MSRRETESIIISLLFSWVVLLGFLIGWKVLRFFLSLSICVVLPSFRPLGGAAFPFSSVGWCCLAFSFILGGAAFSFSFWWCCFPSPPFGGAGIPLLFCWWCALFFSFLLGGGAVFLSPFWRCCFPCPPFGGAACSPSFLLCGAAWLPSSFWVVLLFFLLLVVVLPPFPSFLVELPVRLCSRVVLLSGRATSAVLALDPLRQIHPCVLSRGSIWHVSALRRWGPGGEARRRQGRPVRRLPWVPSLHGSIGVGSAGPKLRQKRKDASGRYQIGMSAVTLVQLSSPGTSALQPVGIAGNEVLQRRPSGCVPRGVFHSRTNPSPPSRAFCLCQAARLRGRTPCHRCQTTHIGAARILARPLLDEAAWTKWCRCDPSGSFVPKAVLPERAARLQDAREVSLRKAGRTSIIKKTKAITKQSIFTRRRRVHLMWAGGEWRWGPDPFSFAFDSPFFSRDRPLSDQRLLSVVAFSCVLGPSVFRSLFWFSQKFVTWYHVFSLHCVVGLTSLSLLCGRLSVF